MACDSLCPMCFFLIRLPSRPGSKPKQTLHAADVLARVLTEPDIDCGSIGQKGDFNGAFKVCY